MSEPHIQMPGFGECITPTPFGEGNESAQNVEQRFLEHFGLSEQPFGVTPDPRFLYLGPKHRQALASLNYGTELHRGFLTLIARPGMGKTSLLFSYLEGLRNKARTVFLFQPAGDSRELMSYILADLGLDASGKDLPEVHSILNQVLMEEMRAGRRFILVIDEAQNLTESVLESVRLLSNFETPWMKLMQIVLAGQPQLAERLATPSIIQLRQRVSFAIEIEPLASEEVTAYVDHRLWVAGYKGAPLFSIGARTLLAEHSEGIPRNINNMCFCAMSLGWATKRKTVDREMMRDILTGMDLGSPKEKTDFVPKTTDPPKQTVVQSPRAPVLVIKEPRARGWFPKAVVASVVLFALGWSAVHADIGKRFMVLWHGISAVDRSSVVTAPAPASLEPAAPAGPDNYSPGAKSEARTNKSPGAAQQDGTESTFSSRDTN